MDMNEQTSRERRAVEANPLWYHTLELAPGVVTPGWFDLRGVADLLPWPDLRGRRCLDVGTYDGFLAFELERRGAAEVVAIDLDDHARWDWPVAKREFGPARLAELAGQRKGMGFELAREALGSEVERRELSVYELDPDEHGRFDVVVCGSLLLHLRDPVLAIERMCSVCDGEFLSAEAIDPVLTAFGRRRPLARVMAGDRMQWWVPNAAGHVRMLESGGFEPIEVSRPYSIPLGAGHPAAGRPNAGRLERLAMRRLGTRPGVLHQAIRARAAG